MSTHLIRHEIIAFIIDRQARDLSPKTISYYQNELNWFANWLQTKSIANVEDIQPETIRLYLIHLAETRNAGGKHASWRAIKAWLNWYGDEIDEPTWKNPIRKVAPPKTRKEPLPGISIPHYNALLVSCDKSAFGQRDRALLTALLDTGLRGNEMSNLNVGDIEMKTGAIQVRNGKGKKDRTVYLGASGRKELIRYLRYRGETTNTDPLWLNQSGERLKFEGIREMISRHAIKAGIPEPSVHDFRRTFAIECLRNGMNVVTLMHLMGHTTTTVLLRYLKLIESDLATGHRDASPADNLKK